MGLERVLMLLEAEGIEISKPLQYDIFVTYMGEHRLQAFDLVRRLRQDGIRADLDHCGRSLKAQFKYANKTGAPLTAVIGDEEAANGTVKIKSMATGEETTVPVDEACGRVRTMI
jgi:histidyl-tRNA synthetase